MVDTSKSAPVASSGTSAAKHEAPEGRLSPDQTVAPAFDAAAEGVGADEAALSVDQGETESGGDAARFEAIKAECRYCGRSLDRDPSL